MRTIHPVVTTAILSVSMALASGPAWAAPGSFTGLGSVAGANESFGLGLSGDGQIAVGVSCCPALDTAFRWDGATLTPLGTGKAVAASQDGSVLVGATGTNEACRWTGAGVIPELLGAGLGSVAMAVSANGLVIVGMRASGPFRWTSAGLVDLSPLPAGATGGAAAAVSDDGLVIAGRLEFPGGPQPFRWTGSTFEVLTLPAGFVAGRATALSADGSIMVGNLSDGSNDHAFRWTATGGFELLGALTSGGASTASAVSDDGAVIVGTADASAGEQPFVWTSALGMRDLQVVLIGYGLSLTGWELFAGGGVSGDGRSFVGTGDHSPGNDEAWVAKLPGAPDILALAMLLVSSYVPGTDVKSLQAAESMNDWLEQAVKHLAKAGTTSQPQVAAKQKSLARDAIRRALARVDGCALRGQVDVGGAGGDWILTCSAQAPLYAYLHDALLGI